MLTFSAAFYALLLANILFTTQIWGWSVLQAGIAVTPAPMTAALTAPIAGLLSDRFGQRVVAIPGALLFAAGCLYFAGSMDATADYTSEMLPGQFLTGAGVGLSFAAGGSAAVAGLPAARFATGSAILSCLRQVGAVLGIAVLVALLESASPTDPVGAFHSAWTVMAGTALVTAAIALALGRVRPLAVTDIAPPVTAAAPLREAA
jgi:MFS family permease